jgi:hypothetical protein
VHKSIPWNLYVGYTNLYLRERWKRYEELSPSVSKFFRSGKVIALEFRYDLTKGLGPYDTKEEGIWAEGALALTLSRGEHEIYSEQLKVAIARNSC